MFTKGTNWIKSHLAKNQTSTAFAYIVCCFIITWKLRLSNSRSFKKSFRNPTRVPEGDHLHKGPIWFLYKFILAVNHFRKLHLILIQISSMWEARWISPWQNIVKNWKQWMKALLCGLVVIYAITGISSETNFMHSFYGDEIINIFCHKLHWCEKTWLFSGWWCILHWVHCGYLLLCHGETGWRTSIARNKGKEQVRNCWLRESWK